MSNINRWKTLSYHNDGCYLFIFYFLIVSELPKLSFNYILFFNSGLFSVAVHCNQLKRNCDYSSKPPENDAPTKKKFSFSGKSFTSRMKKRSLDPTTRISTMMPLEPSKTVPEPSETFSPKKDVRYF